MGQHHYSFILAIRSGPLPYPTIIGMGSGFGPYQLSGPILKLMGYGGADLSSN